jgi:DNA-binding XRE family transcriptional regulator
MIHKKRKGGKDLWYVWGAVGDEKWERAYPEARSRSDLYGLLRQELGLPTAASNSEVSFALMHKTWDGERWVDDFSVQLRTNREKKGWTQAELAAKAGLSTQAVAAIEQGNRSPTWETVLRLAGALEIPETDFKIPVPKQD